MNQDESPAHTVRAVLIENHTFMRQGLLEPGALPGINVVAAYDTIDPLLNRHVDIDLVILDLHLRSVHQPDATQGKAAIRALSGAGYNICLYTEEEHDWVLGLCMGFGASGIVNKSDTQEDTVDAFMRVARGERVLSDVLAGTAELLAHHGQLKELTDREQQYLHLRARGLGPSEISKRLFVREDTAAKASRKLADRLAGYFGTTNFADIERAMGLAPGDILYRSELL